MNYKDALDRLNSYRKKERDLWATFFLGTQIAPGMKRVYRAKGVARNRVVEILHWYGNGNANLESRKKIVQELEDAGLLEFRLISDTSPRFPFNIEGVNEEQAKRFKQMLDASDDEMVNLAITTLEQLKNKSDGNDESNDKGDKKS